MGDRFFAAVVPPADVLDELDRMVDPRRDDAWGWSDPEHWHVTLAFYESVDGWRYEPLVDALTAAAARTASFPLSFEGVGCFASAARANVLYAAVDDVTASLPPLAARCRTAATTVGIEVARQKFHPHLTLARRRRAADATKHLKALVGLYSSVWQVSEIALVQSFLGQGRGGRPRYEVRERLPLST